MEIVNGVSPFHDHDVREWSRINSLTGVLERARIETDHWTSNTNNSVHKYGKVVDSRDRTDADGALRQQARRQLEVFQSQLPGAQLQVIKTHTVSSSRWISNNQSVNESPIKDFENLQVTLNQLDLSTQKAKASIGRSVARRPPTRKPKEEPAQNLLQQNPHITASLNLQKVSRLCHEVHDNAVRQAFGNFSNLNERLKVTELEGADELKELTDNTKENTKPHNNLCRTKSTSSEDIFLNENSKNKEDLETLEQLQSWKRSSKIRRSLQYLKSNQNQLQKNTDFNLESGNVRKITEEFEKGKKINTSSNHLDLQRGNLISSGSSNSDTSSNEQEKLVSPKKEIRKNSIVTEESLLEIKNNLRRVKSPDIKLKTKDSDSDDGIVTEEIEQKLNMKDSDRSSPTSKVKSYVYGMESAFKITTNGTGSLESRSKFINGVTANRTDDWYNRRKSYGFEPVKNENESISKSKNMVESSTDSGICRSNEIIVVPPTVESNSDIINSSEDVNNYDLKDRFGGVKKMSFLFDHQMSQNNYNRRLSLNEGFKSSITSNGVTIKIPIVANKFSSWQQLPDKEIKRHSIAVDETKYVHPRRTSLIINDKFLNSPVLNENDAQLNNKKLKKVEFCKTEVHFAAESGKVNIVETDEKPPPTQNFRRRRRNCNNISPTNELYKNNQPLLYINETLNDKSIIDSHINTYSNTDDTTTDEDIKNENVTSNFKSFGTVTVNSDLNGVEIPDEDKREFFEPDNIKGILKNKIAKPKPYLLGNNPFELSSNGDSPWKKIYNSNDNSSIWKSTVTLSNTVFKEKSKNNCKEIPEKDDTVKIENQPDLIKDQIRYFGENQHRVKILSPPKNAFSLSVADRVKQMEETQKQEHGGYLTKVSFGDGQAFVIENSKRDSASIEDGIKGLKNIHFSNGFTKFESNKIEPSNKKNSPITLRKHAGLGNKVELKTANIIGNLSSPSLVGRNMSATPSSVESYSEKNNYANNILNNIEQKTAMFENKLTNTEKKVNYENKINSIKQFTPDYLENNKKSILHSDYEKESKLKESKIKSLQSVLSLSNNTKQNILRSDEDAPIYENVSSLTDDPPPRRTFDSSILDELTKAADEILQTVNERSNVSSKLLNEKESLVKTSKLTTITENKSWKPMNSHKVVENSYKNRLCRTASNSSLDSNKEPKKNAINFGNKQKNKEKPKASSSEASSVKAATKARRIQRASSREALLQSRGSSSDDISNSIEPLPIRKPRVTKKKSPTLSSEIGTDLNKRGTISTNAKRKEEIVKTKATTRITGALPEIRHKTAVSAIRSTAEKCLRDKGKFKSEEARKKNFGKDIAKGCSPARNDRNKGAPLKEQSNVKLSTTNIKRYRLDGCLKN